MQGAGEGRGEGGEENFPKTGKAYFKTIFRIAMSMTMSKSSPALRRAVARGPPASQRCGIVLEEVLCLQGEERIEAGQQ